MPGYSYFLRDGEDIFDTYSTFARGAEYVGPTYVLLDLTALGRREDREEPKGRVEPVRGGDPTFTSLFFPERRWCLPRGDPGPPRSYPGAPRRVYRTLKSCSQVLPPSTDFCQEPLISDRPSLTSASKR